MSSICQIGLVAFENGIEVGSDVRLINPNDHFDCINISIHGIDEAAVKSAPSFQQSHDWLSNWLMDEVTICHTHFDRVALAQAYAEHGNTHPSCRWIDSARVSRRVWPQYAKSGYGLANIASDFGIAFQHHDAVEDARAAGLIFAKAMAESDTTLDHWLAASTYKSSSTSASVRREGDGDGPLVGESIVFTGALQISRSEAADSAHEAGAAVEAGVTKHTTILVVGDQDVARLAGKSKSSKHIKAESLIAKGQNLRILAESDFLAFLS